jgi:tripartite-type tricarboxylate transporter receptor subunit TctC
MEMTMLAKRILLGLATGALALPLSQPAMAVYPDRPITLIVAWAAGGGTDSVARVFAAGLEKEIGQPVNVINRTGGGGVTGHTAIATAKNDGYTIGIASSDFVLYRTMAMADMSADSFDLVSRVATIPAGITVQADGPYKTLKDVIEAIKTKPKGSLTTSGSGAGGSWHLAIGGMTKAMGLPADQVKFVPSTGGAPALNDLAAGGLSMVTASPIEAKALHDAGKVKVLTVMDSQRLASFPDVPTLKEATGIDWELINWFALVMPKGVPADARAKLIAAATKAHARADVQQPLKDRGITPKWETPEQFAAFAKKYTETSSGLLKDLGLAKN